MKILDTIAAVSLAVIAVNMTYSNFGSKEPAVVTAAVPNPKVVQVISKFATPYDAFGGGSSGYVVQDGTKLRIVKYDPNSMLDRMSAPKYLAIDVLPNGREMLTPIELY